MREGRREGELRVVGSIVRSMRVDARLALADVMRTWASPSANFPRYKHAVAGVRVSVSSSRPNDALQVGRTCRGGTGQEGMSATMGNKGQCKEPREAAQDQTRQTQAA